MSNEKAAPIPDFYVGDGSSHWDDCWRHRGHHACAQQRIATLTAEVAALKAEIARRDAPVSDAEWDAQAYAAHDPEDEYVTRKGLNALILARATPPQDGGMKWISVKELLPKNGTVVLTWRDGYVEAAVTREWPHGGVYFATHSGALVRNPSHWMPLPEPPES